MKKHIVSLALASLLSAWNGEAQARDFEQYLLDVDFVPTEFVSAQGTKALFKVSDDWRNMFLDDEPVMIEKDTLITAYAYHKTSEYTDYCVRKIEAPDGIEFKPVVGDVPCLAVIRDSVEKVPEHQGQKMMPYAFLAKNAGDPAVQQCPYRLNYWSAEDKLWMVLSYSVQCAPGDYVEDHSGSPLYSHGVQISIEEGEGIKGHFIGDMSVSLGPLPPNWAVMSWHQKEKWLMAVVPQNLPAAIQEVIHKLQNVQISATE